MKLAIIAAVGKNREIGKGGKLLWDLPDDRAYFRGKTLGHAIIMGRKTFESIGELLPHRTNIIISRCPNLDFSGILVTNSLESALILAKPDPEPFVTGGEQIYKLALPKAQRLYLTEIEAEAPADAHFPKFDKEDFEIIWSKHHFQDSRHKVEFTFRIYQRKES